MQPNQLISIQEFCQYNRVDVGFIDHLTQQGLIETTTVGQVLYVQVEHLPRLEKFVRLHVDLSIHPDDLDIVSNLLEQVESLQQELTRVRNRLAFYES
ncbi:chaperone modulator CbpM [Spirosoma montaniterrae]|uniref:MerR family transcriptional regulator n=1 Tax=Spirosoma montaniterrae TaxID=1178516 RepID=A0A1P9X051_9BACT|nr:chaperone modulator CbpM [Spirosoma montaniterrae]AQG81011.1 hypothetical protein AWR27_17795 [Spirosoma montaniterrae]